MLSAMNLSSSYGVSATMPFILGALIGVILITIFSISGVSALMMGMPLIFDILKYFGAAFLGYLAMDFLRKQGKLPDEKDRIYANMAQKKLMAKGFVTAILNPKGWLFFAAVLPAFLTDSIPMQQQFITIILSVMCIEFISMAVYAFCGDLMGSLFSKSQNVKTLNRINAAVMIILALWLVFG